MSEQAPTAPEQEQMPSPKASLNEHAAYFDKHPEEIGPEYMNNMYLWMPGSEYLKMIEKHMGPEARRRAAAITEELEAQPDVQAAVNAYGEHIEAVERELEQISQAMEQEMANVPEEDRIAKFRSLEPLRIRQTELKRMKERPQELNEALIPLYIALRKKGFSHAGLVG